MATIVITGATDGIGYALAKRYVERGDRPILVGRRNFDDLADSFFTKENYVVADLSQPDALARINSFLEEHQIPKLDLLVHNAGMGYYGPLADQPLENISALVDVNFLAPVTLTHALVSRLKGGKVAFISTVAVAMPTPDYAVYTATKAALDGFAVNLRTELAPYEIDVAVIHPGATRTNMHQKVGMPGDTSKYPSPEKVAAEIQAALDSNADDVTVGLVNKVLRFTGETFAGLVDSAMRGAKK